jgi:hypothetical protein
MLQEERMIMHLLQQQAPHSQLENANAATQDAQHHRMTAALLQAIKSLHTS